MMAANSEESSPSSAVPANAKSCRASSYGETREPWSRGYFNYCFITIATNSAESSPSSAVPANAKSCRASSYRQTREPWSLGYFNNCFIQSLYDGRQLRRQPAIVRRARQREELPNVLLCQKNETKGVMVIRLLSWKNGKMAFFFLEKASIRRLYKISCRASSCGQTRGQSHVVVRVKLHFFSYFLFLNALVRRALDRYMSVGYAPIDTRILLYSGYKNR